LFYCVFYHKVLHQIGKKSNNTDPPPAKVDKLSYLKPWSAQAIPLGTKKGFPQTGHFITGSIDFQGEFLPMLHVIMALKKVLTLLQRHNMHRALIVLVIVLLGGSTMIYYLEDNLGFFDAMWWSIVTMTTVGYGDISPASPGGRLVAILVMLCGIGLLGFITATLAGIFIENRLLEKRGMKQTRIVDHFIICGWNFRGKTILVEMKADPKCSNIPIVVIADVNEILEQGDQLVFIKGQVNKETLDKANAKSASAAIVLSDDTLDTYARDAKAILDTMTLKTHFSDLYTCVELMDPTNMEHCRLAKADEIIVAGEISTNLLVQAALDHGITRLVSELVSNRYGHDLYKVKCPHYLVGKSFFEVMCDLKEKHNIICIGIEDPSGRTLTANPDKDQILKTDDCLMVISWDRPKIS